MAQLVVRKLEASVVQRLRQRAASAGISMEEAHRRILRSALGGEGKTFKEHLLSIPSDGGEGNFERQRTTSRRKLRF